MGEEREEAGGERGMLSPPHIRESRAARQADHLDCVTALRVNASLGLDWWQAGHMTTPASGERNGNPMTRSRLQGGGCVYVSGGVLRCLSQDGKRSGSHSNRK